MKLQVSALMAFLFAGTPTLLADQYLHRIYNFSWPETSTCQAEAQSIANHLNSLEDVSVLGTLCERSGSSDRYKVTIRYESPEPLRLVSTYTFDATYDDKGIFASREECEAQLGAEASAFADFTGLEPLYMFCSHERLTHSRPWYPQIEAFGSPLMYPSRSSWNSDRLYGSEGSEVAADVARRFELLGLHLRHLGWRTSGVGGKFTAFYYAEEPMRRQGMSSHIVATIPGLEDCREQALQMNDQLLGRDEMFPIITYCSSGYSNPTWFELVTVIKGMGYFEALESEETYSDYETCLTALPQVSDNWFAVYGDRIKATICGYPRFSNGSNAYKVIAFRGLR